MTTARDIIKKALQKIGSLVKSESPSADEATDGLSSLNALLDSWSNDSLSIYARTWETFNLVGGTASYTIGSSGVFNTTRPTNIVSAYVTLGTTNYPLTIFDDEAWATISVPTLQNIPQFLNYDNSYPLGIIRLFNVPSSAMPIFLLTEKPLTSFATLDTALSMPPGTERALIYNLAVELAPEYSQKPDEMVIKIAMESLGLLKAKVAQVRGMDAFPLSLQVRNIYTGYLR